MPCLSSDVCSDRKSTRLNSSHTLISYAVFCLKKKNMERHGSKYGTVKEQYYFAILYLTIKSFFFFFNDPATPEIYTLSLPDVLPINDTATTEIYTLSLHDALPISVVAVS